jgi:methionine-rich copper-binding protein CopC
VLAALVALLGAACAPTFLAPPRLIAAWPGLGASLARPPEALDLTFNRALAAATTSVHVSRSDDGWQPRTSAEVDPNEGEHLSVHLADRLGPGEYQVQWHAVAERTLAVQDGEYAFTVTGEAGASPHVSVEPGMTDVGQVVEVNGQGFGSDQPVDLKIGDDQLALGSAKTDKRGNFSIDLHIPAQVAAGVQPVVAQDARGDRAAAAVRVHWGGWPPLLAWTTGVAGPRPGNVTLEVMLQNRSDYVLEGVRVEMPVPDGASVVAADQGGHEVQRVLTWDLGWIDRGTAGPLRATFQTAGPLATHATIHFRHRRPHDCSGDECLTAFVSETVSDSAPLAP